MNYPPPDIERIPGPIDDLIYTKPCRPPGHVTADTVTAVRDAATRPHVRWSRTTIIEGDLEEITPHGYNIRTADGRLVLCDTEDATIEEIDSTTCTTAARRGAQRQAHPMDDSVRDETHGLGRSEP